MVADKGSHMDKVSKKEDREGTIILHYTVSIIYAIIMPIIY
jgi:hypothetical protein